jgi:uncharacterized protein (TIGR03118 family)
MKKMRVVFPVIVALMWGILAAPQVTEDQPIYTRTNLVSDIAGVARFTDPNLVNPWGLAFGPASPFWVADNNTGLSTLYRGDGKSFPVSSPLVVAVPPPAGGTSASPTGLVFNGTSSFVVSASNKSGPAIFIFATEDGTISGWSPAVDVHNAILVVDNSAPGGVDNSTLGAVYKGLAMADKGSTHLLYAANFRDGFVEVYNSSFKFLKSFTDTSVPSGFAPFGIQNINGKLFVAFAKQNDKKHDDVAGPGNGFVDTFDADGNLLDHFASGGTLNSPWGLALALEGFGKFSHHLLVGNFGDGRINAFGLNTGHFDGQLIDPEGNPLTINGLWAMRFGNGAPNGGSRNKLFFTAGIADESHGLFGFIKAGRGEEEEDGN